MTVGRDCSNKQQSYDFSLYDFQPAETTESGKRPKVACLPTVHHRAWWWTGAGEAIPEIGGEIPINIPNEILTVAKDAMIRFGTCAPTLFVHGTKGKRYMYLPECETLTERVSIMTKAGKQMGQAGEAGEIEQVIYVFQGWSSPARTPYIRPSLDPNRIEVLVLSALDAKTNTQTLEMYACVRDAKQAVTDLKRIPLPEDTPVESPLMPAFLAGYRQFYR
jgi:hypothetical protein